jgi:hypothetical protein
VGGREGNVTAFLTSHVAVIREWFREKHRVNHECSDGATEAGAGLARKQPRAGPRV